MSDYNDELMRYEEAAEDQYDDYDNDDMYDDMEGEDDFDTGFEGLEDDGQVDCSPQEIRALYEKRFQGHSAAVRTLALANGCDYRRASTATPYLQVLGNFLVERTG